MMVVIAQALSHGHMIVAWAIFLVSYFVFAVGRLRAPRSTGRRWLSLARC